MLETKPYDHGDFRIEFYYGLIILTKLSQEKIEEVKANGHRGNFLLNADYNINEGILYLKGELTQTQPLYGGAWGEDDFNTQEEIDKWINELYIKPEKIYTSIHKKLVWLKIVNYSLRYIKKGCYLHKKGSLKEYKTSFFRIEP